MSFMRIPTNLRIPRTPFSSHPNDEFWRGEGYDRGLFAFSGGSGNFGAHIISSAFAPSLVVDGNTLHPVFSDVNGYMYWETNRSATTVHYTRSWGWVYLRGGYAGQEPVEEWDPDRQKYTGDSFHVVPGFPWRDDGEVNLQARGSSRDDAPVTLRVSWPRWTCDDEFGVYAPAGGADGERTMGVPRFRGNYWEEYTRSFSKDGTGHYTYGAIHWADGRWVIGTPGSPSGWHEGAEPTPGGSTTFRFTKNEGSEAAGSDIAVSFERWVCGDGSATALVGEAAVWR